MLKRCIIGAVAVCLALGSYALTKPAPVIRDGDTQRIDELVQKLGSSKFAERNLAQKELEAIGAPALDALRKAAKDGDLETTKRAADLVRKLEDRIFTAQLLTPRRVHLKVKDMPVLDAVAELARLSGYPIVVQGDRTKVSEAKVTIDTGDVTFWEALDKLCAAGALVEMTQGAGFNPYDRGTGIDPGINPRPIRALPPRQIRPVGPPVEVKPPEAKPVEGKPVEGKPLEGKPAEAPKPKADVPKEEVRKEEARIEDQLQLNALKEARVEAALQEALRARELALIAARVAQENGKAGAAQAQQAAARAAEAQAIAQVVQERAKAVAAQAAQVQILPAQPQFQPVPFPGGQPGMPGRPGFGSPGQIILVPGTAKNELSSYAGAVRVRVLPTPDVLGKQAKKNNQYTIVLDVAAEPKLVSFNVTGTFTIEKAIDNQGQTLTIAVDMPMGGDTAPAGQGGGVQAVPAPPAIAQPAIQLMDVAMPVAGPVRNRQIVVRLKAGEKQARALKELTGTLAAQVMTPPEALITMDNVMKGAGQTAKGKDGRSLQLTAIDKMPNGDYKVQFKLEANQQMGGVGAMNGIVQFQAVQIVQGGNVQVQIGGGGAGGGGVVGGGSAPGMPELLDAKGNKYQIAQIPARRFNFNNGVGTQEMTIIYRAANGAGDPDRLVVTGSRMATITIPFAFQNVPVQ